MFKTRIFDLGNVLIFFDHELACSALGALYGREPSAIQGFLFDSGLEWEFEKGLLTALDLHRRFAEWSGRDDVSVAAMKRAQSDIFTLNHPMVDELRSCKASGLRTVLLSNTSESHIEFARERYDFFQYFDAQVLSFEVQAMKPERKIFEAALAVAEARPEECFYLDDIPEYVAAAAEVGICGRVYQVLTERKF